MKQREELELRRNDLESAKQSIDNLIKVLDQRKDEAIERTFKQVSKAFAEVFQKLVPAGRGRLVIQRKTDKQQPGEEDEESDTEPVNKRGVENYTGVGISVSFNSKHDDQQRIQQLSGGQKSKSMLLTRLDLVANMCTGLCSLALIFAIQATDPAPFYIFDEIDANLGRTVPHGSGRPSALSCKPSGMDEPEDGDDRPSGRAVHLYYLQTRDAESGRTSALG